MYSLFIQTLRFLLTSNIYGETEREKRSKICWNVLRFLNHPGIYMNVILVA
jgi:hypothetical protein